MERLDTEPEPSLAMRPPADTAVGLNGLRERALTRGVNPVLHWPARAILVPFFLIYFRRWE